MQINKNQRIKKKYNLETNLGNICFSGRKGNPKLTTANSPEIYDIENFW